MPDHNSANTAYGATASRGLNQREREGKMLVKAANAMQELVSNWDEVKEDDINTVIEYNRNLWSLFYNAAEEGGTMEPELLRKNMRALGNFVFQRSYQILSEVSAERQKLLFKALININRQIATGLFRQN